MSGLDIAMGGLYHAAGGVISPRAYCDALIAGSEVTTKCRVSQISGREEAGRYSARMTGFLKPAI